MDLLHSAVSVHSSEAGGFPFSKRVTHHTQNTACLIGPVAAWAITEIPRLRPICPCVMVNYCCRNNGPQRDTHSILNGPPEVLGSQRPDVC